MAMKSGIYKKRLEKEREVSVTISHFNYELQGKGLKKNMCKRQDLNDLIEDVYNYHTRIQVWKISAGVGSLRGCSAGQEVL